MATIPALDPSKAVVQIVAVKIPIEKSLLPGMVWLDFRHLEEADNISFETIEPYLYQPSKDKKKGLKQYSRNYPGSFLADVPDCIK
jgi:hypothetical protein